MPTRSLALVAFATLAALASAGNAQAEEGDVVVTDFPKPGETAKGPAGETRVTDLNGFSSEGATRHDASVTYLDLGPILSLAGGSEHATGIGVEGVLMHYNRSTIPSIGFGPFVQLQLYDGKWLRADAGIQTGFGPVGVELGLGFRQGDDAYASTVSVHAGEYISLGYFSIAVHEAPVLFALPTDKPSYGFETSFVFSVKIPVAIAGHDQTHLVPTTVDRL